MPKYIDTDTFEKFLQDEIEETRLHLEDSCGDEYYEMAVVAREVALRQVLFKLKSELTIDVPEAKLGKWLKSRFDPEVVTCSICGTVYEGGDSFRFCPECGAKMGLEE